MALDVRMRDDLVRTLRYIPPVRVGELSEPIAHPVWMGEVSEPIVPPVWVGEVSESREPPLWAAL